MLIWSPYSFGADIHQAHQQAAGPANAPFSPGGQASVLAVSSGPHPAAANANGTFGQVTMSQVGNPTSVPRNVQAEDGNHVQKNRNVG
jgi:hypothetical protein